MRIFRLRFNKSTLPLLKLTLRSPGERGSSNKEILVRKLCAGRLYGGHPWRHRQGANL